MLQREAGFGFAIDGNGRRDPAAQVPQSVRDSPWRMQVFEHGETSRVRLTKRSIRRRGVIIVCCWIVLAGTTAIARQSVGTVTETVSTRRDLNGRDAVTEKVVTHRDRTNKRGMGRH